MSQKKVYLLHYHNPIGNRNNPLGLAQHYLGSTDNLKARLLEHKNGNGAKITAAFSQKLQELERLYRLGYSYFAIGGLLSNSHNQHQILGIVEIIKKHLPDNCYLHILGVSNYKLVGELEQLGINSHDSSTWVKQAFLGYFYQWKNNKLYKLKLSSFNPPPCSCPACSFFENQPLSKREYKLKLAAHNLIQSLLAYREYQCQEKQLSLL